MRVADCIALAHLKIDFGEESIGVTEEHPFWSEDRNGWVSARRLKVNEVVRSTGNKLVSVQSITRQKQASVYNLEVNRSHSYLVGKSRLVVHNGCGEPSESSGAQEYEKARNKALKWLRDRGFKADKVNLGKFGPNKGMPIGMTTADGRTGFRVEFDERSGAHINVFNRKEKGPHFGFDGNENSVNKIVRRFRCPVR